MPNYQQLLYDMEVHSVEGISRYFLEGGNPNEVHDGKPLFTSMVEMYFRSTRFKACVRAFIDAGLEFDEHALLCVLADFPQELAELVQSDPELVNRQYFLFNNTYTPLTGATLMHFCAEYNRVDCAKTLLKSGADINVKAATDAFGFGGHSPVFHTVNQNGNASFDMLRWLLDEKADLSVTVKGLVWGKGYEWETFIPAVNPVSYAMMGLLPQMHRKEIVISEVVSLLVKHAYGVDYVPANVPNAYLKS